MNIFVRMVLKWRVKADKIVDKRLRRIERAKAIQERILKIKEANTKRAESTKNQKKIKKAKAEEEQARAILKKIEEEKDRLTTHKRQGRAVNPKPNQEPWKEKRPQKEKKKREKYPVNEAFLFSVDEKVEEIEESLNKGVISESLLDLFNKKGVPLSEEAIVTKDCLFEWEKVPGEDNKRFLNTLTYLLNLNWAKGAKITKSGDRKTIRLSKEEKSAEITINEREEKLTLKISDGKTDYLKVKNENGRLNAYKIGKENEWEITDFEDDEETEKFILRKEEGGGKKLDVFMLFASVLIEDPLEATAPPTYRVWEPKFRKGRAVDRAAGRAVAGNDEEALLKEIKIRLYEEISETSTESIRESFLEQKLEKITEGLNIEQSKNSKLLQKIKDLISKKEFIKSEELDPTERDRAVAECKSFLKSLLNEAQKTIEDRLRKTINESFEIDRIRKDFLDQKVQETIKEHYKEQSQDRRLIEKLKYYITRDFIGYSKLDPIMNDKMVEDISVDGPNIPLYVFHRRYDSIRTSIIFEKTDLDAIIYKLAQRAGRHISLAKPLLNASLPNNDRLQLSLGDEVTTKGSTFTIRKFREEPLTPIYLIKSETFSTEMMAYLWMAVENGFNILIAGGTASGKTTTLNAIAMFIPPESKIISIEDTREINLSHENWIPDVTREVEEGSHSIEMFDLLKAALRQRPEYILVGEVRGAEATTLFQAMATGHITVSTVHADSPEAVVRRLTKPPINVPLMLLDSLNIILIQRSVKIGERRERRCTEIIEVSGVDFEKETLKTIKLFHWDSSDKFHFKGESQSKILSEISEKLNMKNEEELSNEFYRRVEILNWMRATVTDFQSLSKIIFEYNMNPREVEEKLKKDRK